MATIWRNRGLNSVSDALLSGGMEILRYLLGGSSVLLGALIVFASYVRQITNFRTRHSEHGHWSSPAPFIGPVLVVVGYLSLPIEFSYWIFLVIVLDPDTVVTILQVPYLFRSPRE